MIKTEFSGSYKGYRIDVYKNDNNTFTSAIENTMDKNTLAKSISQSFRYATAKIERKIEKSEN